MADLWEDYSAMQSTPDIAPPSHSAHEICEEKYSTIKYEGYPESNLRFGIKKPQLKGNIFYYIHLKATILNYFSK